MNLAEARYLANTIIDLVIQTLEDEHNAIQDLSESHALGNTLDKTPRSLLYGEAYYSLEDEIANLINREEL